MFLFYLSPYLSFVSLLSLYVYQENPVNFKENNLITIPPPHPSPPIYLAPTSRSR